MPPSRISQIYLKGVSTKSHCSNYSKNPSILPNKYISTVFYFIIFMSSCILSSYYKFYVPLYTLWYQPFYLLSINPFTATTAWVFSTIPICSTHSFPYLHSTTAVCYSFVRFSDHDSLGCVSTQLCVHSLYCSRVIQIMIRFGS